MTVDHIAYRWRRTMTAKVLATLILATVALTGCVASPEGEARHLTESEAQLMAVARFKNYNAGARAIVATIRDSTEVWKITGWFDYAHDVGYASLTARSSAAHASALLLWSTHSLFSRSAGELEGEGLPPLPAPNTDEIKQTWASTQYQPNIYGPQAALLIIASLGSDRPENPMLLQQSDALWLREDHIGKTRVNVFAGPSSATLGTASPKPNATISPDASTIRYWLNDSGVMLRVEMRLGGTHWSSVDLAPVPEKDKPQLPELLPSTSTGP